MKIKLLAFVTAATLLSPLSVQAEENYENYVFSLQLLAPNKEEILRKSSRIFEGQSLSETNKKTYAITECIENPQKRIRAFKGKDFISGYSYSVNPKSGLVKFTEYQIDDSQYKSYEKKDCFQGEVKQVEFTSTQKVSVGNKEPQEFLLPNGKILNLAIYKENRL